MTTTSAAKFAPATSSLAGVLQPFVDQCDIAGAVTLVGTRDRILALDAVGSADIAGGIAMQENSMFWIASMTKPITGAALMMLVDEGKVSVDDPVEKYIPDFKEPKVVVYRDATNVLLRKPAQPILVRHLLSHTAGLPFSTPVEWPKLDQLSLRTAVRSYAWGTLEFEPGTKYGYANAGTNTAGYLIELLSGQPYEKFLDERLFGPLGMKDTTFWPRGEQLARVAKIYKLTEGAASLVEGELEQLSSPFDDAMRHPMPAGGLFSTALDCYRMCRMVLGQGEADGKRYLQPETVKQMTSKQTGDLVDVKYGFAWDAQDESTGHGGAYKTCMTIYPALDLITIFLVHHNGAGFPTREGETVSSRFTAAAKELRAQS